jgi:hypothetical protein
MRTDESINGKVKGKIAFELNYLSITLIHVFLLLPLGA